MKIAIIGSGISGLGAAHLLAPRHDITLYEKNARAGGHSRTITINIDGRDIAVDTGFIVFNDRNYPELMRLFDAIGVEYVKSDMSFGVRIGDMLEYSSGDLFAWRNITRPAYLRMLVDILRFNKKAARYIDAHPSVTLGECLDAMGLGAWARDYYVLAMGAEIWSCSAARMHDFPAASFLAFFRNHGLLNITGRPQWFSVKGGAREYVRRITEPLGEKLRLDCGAKKIMRRENKWHVVDTTGGDALYDAVILACHADEALAMIESPADGVAETLGAFSYQKNTIITHSDLRFMPKVRKCRASWNYLADSRNPDTICMSYWMNNLQPLEVATPVIITLNPPMRPDENLIHDEHVFAHPRFDAAAIAAQKRLPDIQGRNGLWFCGAYHGYGFHEDGLASAIDMVAKMQTGAA